MNEENNNQEPYQEPQYDREDFKARKRAQFEAILDDVCNEIEALGENAEDRHRQSLEFIPHFVEAGKGYNVIFWAPCKRTVVEWGNG